MRTTFIADIGSCHNGDIDRAVALIEGVARAEFAAAKFQLFDERLTTIPEARAVYRRWALPMEWLPALHKAAHRNGIQLHMTVTSIPFVYAANPFCDAVKIGSYEILDLDLIAEAARTGKPIGISTGGATMSEAYAAMRTAERNTIAKITLFHCSPNYPALPEDCGLMTIQRLAAMGPYEVGWSDHTVKLGVVHAAIAAGATTIEVHVDLDGADGWESEYGHCWEMTRARKLIESVRDGEKAMRGAATAYEAMRLQRTDPSDGRRPMKEARK